MNSDEISAALGRLGESIPKTLEELADAFAGGVWSTVTLRHSLIELLEQADRSTPVGADGVPVRIGDKVTSDEYPDVVATVTQFVPCAICEGIRYTRDGSAVDEVVKYSCYAHKLHHHHSKTVEDVLTEAITAWINPMHKGNVVAEYAAKLREAMRNE